MDACTARKIITAFRRKVPYRNVQEALEVASTALVLLELEEKSFVHKEEV